MIRGLYTAASGMVAQQKRMDTIANNMANVNTAGFKRDETVVEAFPQLLLSRLNDPGIPGAAKGEIRPLVGGLGTGARLQAVLPIFTQGPLRQTEAPLDVAIAGDGFFVVQTPAGEAYTRNGAFQLDEQGYLVTSAGYRVLGQGGPIRVQPGSKVVIDEQGQVTANGQPVGKLRVVAFANPQALQKLGDSLFQGTGATPLAEPVLRPGFLEQSNVNPVLEMVNMLTAMRTYEAGQKTIQAEDQLLEKAVNEVGRV
ncbi:flagellar basal-body rod protein FlgF [Carboxydocella sp. JDF658]|uniref:flagellar basal-body rod protein FlgF n=1 Tax=Carboxydocella sp. JDF658 TaxID=1926600 RepID=UPI0009AD7C60|nr:flagellar basal-body rod protein FlgF [Carboxydocella sp. JDF658]GAW31229.1 flagellar basal-body rod protein FlgF [Carboxydocella sp. JDF658]